MCFPRAATTRNMCQALKPQLATVDNLSQSDHSHLKNVLEETMCDVTCLEMHSQAQVNYFVSPIITIEIDSITDTDDISLDLTLTAPIPIIKELTNDGLLMITFD